MASFTEAKIDAVLIVAKEEDGSTHVFVQARSMDDDGRVIRVLRREDITEYLSGAQVTGAANILDSAIARLKTVWNIP